MAVIQFNLDEVRKQFDHAKQCTTFRPTFGEQHKAFGDDCMSMDYDKLEAEMNEKGMLKPALWLVKDNGVYIMSNGHPDDPNYKERPDVAYARGINPNTDGDVYDEARDAMGGDDCCELLDHDLAKSLCEFDTKGNTLEIVTTGENLEFRIPVYGG